MTSPQFVSYQTLTIVPVPFLGLPRWQPPFSSEEDSDGEPSERLAKLRVIVIDDEVLIAETVVEILKDEGFDARAVHSASAAMELAASLSPDIILSDVIMPGMTGIELGMKIRTILPRCKVILFSGQAATVDLLEKARKQGHHFEILAKPIRPEALVQVVRKACERP